MPFDLSKIPSDDEQTGGADLAKIPASGFEPPPPPKATIGDYLKGAAGGTAGEFVTNPGQAFRLLGVGDGLVKKGQDIQGRIAESMTPGGRAVSSNPVIKDDGTIGDTPVQSALMSAVSSAPSFAGGVVAGAPLAKQMVKANVADRVAGAVGKAGVPGTAARVVGDTVEALPFGVIEGMQAGLAGSADIGKQVREADFAKLSTLPEYQKAYEATDPSLPPAQRQAAAREAMAQAAERQVFGQTAASTGGIGVLTQGGAMRLAARPFIGKAGNETGGLLAAIGRGARSEAIQEAPQSAGEQLIQNFAAQRFADPTTGTWDGVLNAAVTGAAAGGLLGAGGGGIGYLARPRRDDQTGQPGQPEAPMAPMAPPVDPSGPLGAAVVAGQQSGAIPTNPAGGPVDAPPQPGPGDAPTQPGQGGAAVTPGQDDKTSALTELAQAASSVPPGSQVPPDSEVGRAVMGAVERAAASGATADEVAAALAGQAPQPSEFQQRQAWGSLDEVEKFISQARQQSGRVPEVKPVQREDGQFTFALPGEPEFGALPDARQAPEAQAQRQKQDDERLARVESITKRLAQANAAAEKAREAGDEETAGNAETVAGMLRDRLEAARRELDNTQGADDAGTGVGGLPGTDLGAGTGPGDVGNGGAGAAGGRALPGGSLTGGAAQLERPAGGSPAPQGVVAPTADGGGAGAVDPLATIEEFRQRFSKMPPGMSPEQYRSFIDGRNVAEAQAVARLVEAAQAGGLALPSRTGGSLMMTPEPTTGGATWRVTRLMDDGTPAGHMEFNTPEQAAANLLSAAGRPEQAPAAAVTPTAAPKPAKPPKRTRQEAAAIRRQEYERVNPFKAFLAKHGVNIADRSDVGGDKRKAVLVPYFGAVFRKNGMRLDELALLAAEAGFLTQSDLDSIYDNGGVNKLADMIRRTLAGERITSSQAAVSPEEAEYEALAQRYYEEQEDAEQALVDEATDDEINALAQLARQEDAEASNEEIIYVFGLDEGLGAPEDAGSETAGAAAGTAPGGDPAGGRAPGLEGSREVDPFDLAAPTQREVIERQQAAERGGRTEQEERARLDAERAAADEVGFLQPPASGTEQRDTTGDMFGGPTADDLQAQRRRERREAPDPGGLFAPQQLNMVEPSKIEPVRFASGLSRLGDLANGGRATGGLDKRGIGVDVGELSVNAIETLANAVVNLNTRVFIDSGAFGAFRRGLKTGDIEPLDFDSVLAKYDQVLEAIQDANEAEVTDYPRPLMVMPDVVGDQRASLDLVGRYKNWIAAETRANTSRPIVPIQKGELTMAQAYREVVATLGTDNFIVGIPSNEAAVTPAELKEFLKEIKPRAVHILGAASGKTLLPRLRSINEAGLDGKIQVTSDASPVRSELLRAVAQGARRGDALRDILFDQDDPAMQRERQRAEGDYLDELFGGQQEAAPKQEDPFDQLWAQAQADEKVMQARKERLLGALKDAKTAAQRTAEEWASKAYKNNKGQVELRGDGPARNGSMSIGAINESRRRKAVDAANAEIAAIEKLERQAATGGGMDRIVSLVDSTMAEARRAIDAGVTIIPAKSAGDYFEFLVLDALNIKPPRGNYTSNSISKALRAFVEGPAVDAAAAEAATSPKNNLPEPTEAQTATSAEQAIRDAFGALPSIKIGSWQPLTVEHNGVTQHFLANQKALSNGRIPAAIHLVRIKHGRMLAGGELQPIANYYRLDGKNALKEEGVPGPANAPQLRMWEGAGFPAPWGKQGGSVPMFATYADAQAWIKEKAQAAGGQRKFASTDEYKEVFPQIKALYDAESAASAEAAMKRFKDAGMKIGDPVKTTIPGMFLGPGRTVTGTVVNRGGRPIVKIDGEMDVSSKGRIQTVKSIAWDARWEKGDPRVNSRGEVIGRDGLTEMDRIRSRLADAAGQLAGQIAESAQDDDFDEAEMAGLPGVIRSWADESRVPADELRQEVIRRLRANKELKAEFKKQVERALDPTRKALESDAPAESKPAGPIGDFGEKIGGARKDTWASFKDRMQEAEGLDIATEPLSKTWPAPDYQALLEAGSDPWAVAFMHAIRDQVPAKPKRTWKLKAWVSQVTMLRDLGMKALDGRMEAAQVRAKLAEAAKSSRGLTDVADRAELYQLVGHGKSLAGVRVSRGEYSLYQGVEHNPPLVRWTVEKDAAATAFSNWPRELASGATRTEALANFKAKYAELEISPPASKEATFDIFSRRGENGYWIGKKIGRNPALLEGPFATLKEARAYKDEHNAELVAKLEKFKDIPRERRDTNEPRVGEDMRGGQDVTQEMFAQAFGFRGVEFGNWVEQKRRQKDLNDAYDALMDMAAVLGVNPKALSLNGELGLAFGARGSGGAGAAAAHYEDGKVVINLTKKEGAGSLGHEWWHALDNYFSRMRGKGSDYMTSGLDVSLAARGSEFTHQGAVRKEMVQAFGEVMKAIRASSLRARSQKLDAKRTKEYWTTPEEMSARAFESYLISKLQDQGASNDYLANIVDEKTWEAAERLGFELEGSYPYPLASEVPSIRAAFDHFFQTVETRETDTGIAMFSRTETPFNGPALAAQRTEREVARLEEAIAGLPKRGAVRIRRQYEGALENARQRLAEQRGLAAQVARQSPDMPFLMQELSFQQNERILQSERVANEQDQQKRRFEQKRLDDIDKEVARLQAAIAAAPNRAPGLSALSRGGAPGMDAPRVTRLAAAIARTWANGPEVVVVQDMQDMRIPEAVRREDAKQRSGGASGDPEGFFYWGKVYLVSGQLDSPADVVRVLSHEALGHYGLRGLFGGELGRILDQVANVRRSDVTAKLQEYGLPDTAAGRRVAAEEVLAVMAQTNPQMGFVRRAVAAIRQWLRGLGVPLQMTDADIVAQFIIPARQWVMRGGGEAAVAVPSFSRGDLTQTPEFRQWFGNSKMVDADGRPLIVYHGGVRFDVFRKSPEALAHYASDDAGVAEGYAEQYDEDRAEVKPLYLRIENPLDLRDESTFEKWTGVQPDDSGASSEWGRRAFMAASAHDVRSGGDILRRARAAGHDGIVFYDTDVKNRAYHTSYAFFDQTQAKGAPPDEARLNDYAVRADGNSGAFDPANPDIRFSRRADVTPLGFYSELARKVEAGPGRADAANWKSYLRAQKGVKPDEIEWSGINEFLDLQQGKITKEAVREYLAANGVRVEQVTLADAATDVERINRALAGTGYSAEFDTVTDDASFIDPDGDFVDFGELPAEVQGAVQRATGAVDGTAKFGQYVLPGGENYREVLLTLPTKTIALRKAVFDEYQPRIDALYARLDAAVGEESARLMNELRALQDERDVKADVAGGKAETSSFRSGHWDQPNVLAHVRLNDRTDADGRRVLFVEEIQSDWAQKGRKYGFSGNPLTQEEQAEFTQLASLYGERGEHAREAKDPAHPAHPKYLRLMELIERGGRDRANVVPPAPFVQKTDAWVALAIKRIVRMAAEGGYDRVAFVTGEQAADRFDLSKQVDAIKATRDGNDFRIALKRKGRPYSFDHNDMWKGDASQLPDVVGKELAEKVAAIPDGSVREFSGLDLKVGGEGMRGFYDQIVPAVAKDVLKKVGGPAPTTVQIARDGVRPMTAAEQAEFDRTATLPDDIYTDSTDQPGFDITPAMRDTVLEQGMPLFSRKPTVESVQAAVNQAAQAVRGATLQGTWQRIVNAATDVKPIGLQFLGRRQIVDIYGNLLPQLEAYSNRMQQYDADKNESAAAADDVVKKWRKLADADRLAGVMHGATLAAYDPDVSTTPADLLTPEMREVYDGFTGLSPEAKALYREARDAYRKHWNAVKKAIGERIERADIAENDRRALMEKYRDEFLKPLEGVYFPLARFGDYVITAKDAEGNKVVAFAETMNEAMAEQARMRRDYQDVSKITKRREYNAARDSVSKEFVRQLFTTIDKSSVDGQQADMLKDAVNQLYLTSLPDVSWAKHGIHRKGVAGYSKDARRAFAANMFHGGYHLAKLRHADVLQDHLREMQEYVEAQRVNEAYDSVTGQQVVDEMVKRHDQTMNPDNNPLANTLTGLGFVWFLGLSPASAIVNLSQTALVAYPVIAARYGFGSTADALTRASKEALAAKNDLRGRLKGDEAEAYERAIREGLIDITQAHDLAGIAEGRDSGLQSKFSPVMRAASWMFHQAEKFNRQATFLAAYRLARSKGAEAGAAYDIARDLTYKGHFDYAASNRPRVMMGPVARVALLFKQYGQNMIYTLTRNALLAARGDRVALRTLSGVLTGHALTAGVLGLPLASVLLGAASLIGGSDDEPWDAEVALRNYLADAFGPGLGEVISRGVFRSFFPGDIASRVGLDSLLIRDIDLTLEPNKVWQEILNAVLGPVAGIGMNAATGASDLARGDLLRGLQGMLPKAVSDGFKALRYWNDDGVVDRTGVEVLEDVTAQDMLAQVFGFSPARVSEAYAGRRAIMDAKRGIDQRRESLLRDFSTAVIDKDGEKRLRALQEIQHFNSVNPTVPITSQSMLRSIQNRMRRQQEASSGVYLPRRQRELEQEGRFANVN